MEKDSAFARRLRAYRGKRTQAEIAMLFNISSNYYGQLERGLKLPSFEMIQNFVKSTGMDANYWFGLESSEKVLSDKQVAQEDISTILSLLHNLSEKGSGLVGCYTEAINNNTTIAQLIVVIAQIRAYLSEVDSSMLTEPDRRTISDLLAACQRALDADRHPDIQERKSIKAINN